MTEEQSASLTFRPAMLFWPLVGLTLFLAGLKVVVGFNISWLWVAAPLAAPIGLWLAIVLTGIAFVVLGMVVGMLVKHFLYGFAMNFQSK